jgi:OFA family oxalate/formate antiporter-like MFS transporter
MALIANLQYGWTLFVNPMHINRGWAVAEIQIAYSIFIALETWLTPIEGWIVDNLGQRGPKLVMAAGGLMVMIGWGVNSIADSLAMLYLGAILTGIGAGGIYATCVGNALKWFPERRGLAVGLNATGFGAGAAITVIPIQMLIAARGYQTTFLVFALVQGGIVFVLAWMLRPPGPGDVPTVAAPQLQQVAHNSTPREVLASPIFWLMYLMFVAVSACGLVATAQIALIAKSYGIADDILLFGATALTVVLIIDSAMNGLARPVFGWISDTIGRENTMALAFGLGGLAYWQLSSQVTSVWMFVACSGVIFLSWGEISSVFPSTCTDTFGPKFATTNSSMLYTAKGTSAFLVPLANIVEEAMGGWHAVFVAAAVINLGVVLLALFVLKPLRVSLARRLRLSKN